MGKKIQRALGRNAKQAAPAGATIKGPHEDVGQAVVSSTQAYLQWGLQHDDGSALVSTISSANLKQSAEFSARAARITYLLGKATLLDQDARRGVVRNQIIEYGSVAEALLLDVVQCIGKQDSPSSRRPTLDKAKNSIDWAGDGLLSQKGGPGYQMRYWFDFLWLTREAHRIGVVDANLRDRIHWLRRSRNLVHPVIPTGQRYGDDVDSSRRARNIVIDLAAAVTAFKQRHGLP